MPYFVCWTLGALLAYACCAVMSREDEQSEARRELHHESSSR